MCWIKIESVLRADPVVESDSSGTKMLRLGIHIHIYKVCKNWVETGEHSREIIDISFICLDKLSSTRL